MSFINDFSLFFCELGYGSCASKSYKRSQTLDGNSDETMADDLTAEESHGVRFLESSVSHSQNQLYNVPVDITFLWRRSTRTSYAQKTILVNTNIPAATKAYTQGSELVYIFLKVLEG